jgi:uncharacterized protein YegP (UPF0339 family)
METSETSPYYIEWYRDRANEFRWRRKGRGNRRTEADSGEGYKNKGDMLESVRRQFPDDEIIEEGEHLAPAQEEAITSDE